MRKLFLLLFALAIVSVRANAQNTPAPCSPANLQCTDQQYGCYNTPDCDTGFMCFFLRTCTDVWYGTTCSSEGMYFCGRQTIAQKEKNHAQVLLARARAIVRNRG